MLSNGFSFHAWPGMTVIPKVRTESTKKGTFYTGAQAFNHLPAHLKEGDSVVIF